jgi:hypothetical protein
MKTTRLVLLSILIAFGFCSFNTIDKENEALIGVWVYAASENGITQYVKSEHFERDKSGLKFKKTGTFIKRQNSGKCGTPPITYKNYTGTWKFKSDSTLTIKYKYWGEENTEDFKIIGLNSRSLKIKTMD